MTLEDQFTPPEAVPLNPDPKLPEPPSVMALSTVKLPQLAQLGDPLTAVQGPHSNAPAAAVDSAAGAAEAWVHAEGQVLGLTTQATCSFRALAV